MSIAVVSKRTHRGNGEYIGRPSPLGNPFVIGRDGDRAQVIDLYEQWLTEIWNAGGSNAQLTELFRLAEIHRDKESLTLVCWCAPARCHGDVLVSFIERIS